MILVFQNCFQNSQMGYGWGLQLLTPACFLSLFPQSSLLRILALTMSVHSPFLSLFPSILHSLLWPLCVLLVIIASFASHHLFTLSYPMSFTTPLLQLLFQFFCIHKSLMAVLYLPSHLEHVLIHCTCLFLSIMFGDAAHLSFTTLLNPPISEFVNDPCNITIHVLHSTP